MKRALLTTAIVSVAVGGLVTAVPAAARAAATVANPDFNAERRHHHAARLVDVLAERHRQRLLHRGDLERVRR